MEEDRLQRSGNAESNEIPLNLESLNEGIPAITKEAVGFYKQNCIFCFAQNGHESGVRLSVKYNGTNRSFKIQWDGDVTDDILRAYEPKSATDHAACAVALILVRELTEYTAVQKSCIGTTIDYYLAAQISDDDLIFNHTARLEVSGILTENKQNTVDRRIAEKRRRFQVEGSLPNLIAIVEFSKPWSKIVKS